jgi:hypothetical protein
MKHPRPLVFKSFARQLFVEFDVLVNPLRRTMNETAPLILPNEVEVLR